MTVEEPRRRLLVAHAAVVALGRRRRLCRRTIANPLVVSFPAGFHPPVSGWEAYEGGPAGQQLLVVARAVREMYRERERERRRKKEARASKGRC